MADAAKNSLDGANVDSVPRASPSAAGADSASLAELLSPADEAESSRMNARSAESDASTSVPPTPTDTPRRAGSLAGSNADDSPSSSRPFFGWRRGDQIVFGTLLVLGIGLMAVHWAWISGWGMRPVEIERQNPRPFEFRLEINQANWIEWTQLPGVGDQLARRIVEYREQNGPFQSIDELRQVQGIGPKTLDKLRPWITVSTPPPALEPSAPTSR